MIGRRSWVDVRSMNCRGLKKCPMNGQKPRQSPRRSSISCSAQVSFHWDSRLKQSWTPSNLALSTMPLGDVQRAHPANPEILECSAEASNHEARCKCAARPSTTQYIYFVSYAGVSFLKRAAVFGRYQFSDRFQRERTGSHFLLAPPVLTREVIFSGMIACWLTSCPAQLKWGKHRRRSAQGSLAPRAASFPMDLAAYHGRCPKCTPHEALPRKCKGDERC